MSLQGFQRVLVVLVIFSLLLTTGASGAAANDLMAGDVSIVMPALVVDEDAASEEEDEAAEESGGWFSNAVDSAGNIAGDVKDGVVDGAGAVWSAAEQAPGAVWNVVQQAPGAIWNVARQTPRVMSRSANGGWERVREILTTKIEVNAWPIFLEAHPILGRVLGPIVWLLTGLDPDGILSYFDIGIGLVALFIPVFKGGQTLTRSLLPWLDDAGSAAKIVRRNPGGIINGARDMIRLRRTKSIVPVAKSFSKLPDSPGVYVALDAQGNVLYVGMSNYLGNRMRQHFGSFPSKFANSTESIKILPAPSSSEARALECRLIKSLWPEFNVLHKNLRSCPAFSTILPVDAALISSRIERSV